MAPTAQINKHFRGKLATAFSRLALGAAKADVIRLCLLYLYGAH